MPILEYAEAAGSVARSQADYAGADRGVGQGVQVRPDAEERHTRRDRLASATGRRTGTSRRRSPVPPMHFTIVKAELDPEHQRLGEARRTRGAAVPIEGRATPPVINTIDADCLKLAIDGLVRHEAVDPGRRPLDARLGRVADDPDLPELTNNGTARRGRQACRRAAPSARRPRSWTPRTAFGADRFPAGAAGINATSSTPSGDAVAGDYVITFKARPRTRPLQHQHAGSPSRPPKCGRSSARRALCARPGTCLRLPDLRSAMSASPGKEYNMVGTGRTLQRSARRAPVSSERRPRPDQEHEA